MKIGSEDFGKTVALLLILITLLLTAKLVGRILSCTYGVADPECKTIQTQTQKPTE